MGTGKTYGRQTLRRQRFRTGSDEGGIGGGDRVFDGEDDIGLSGCDEKKGVELRFNTNGQNGKRISTSDL